MYWDNVLPEDAIRVRYRLADGCLHPPEELYWCTQCFVLLNRWSLIDEIDSYFCPQCVESLPSTEAMACRTCCFRCFDCPRCQHVLSYVSRLPDAGDVHDQRPDSPKQQKSGSPRKPGKLASKIRTHMSGILSSGSPRGSSPASSKVSLTGSLSPRGSPPLSPRLTVAQRMKRGSEDSERSMEDSTDVRAPDTEYRLVCLFCHWSSSHLTELKHQKLELLISSINRVYRESPEVKRLGLLSDALARPVQRLGKKSPAPFGLTSEEQTKLPYSSWLNLPESAKSDRKELWSTVEHLLDAKRERIGTFSSWDLQVTNLMDPVTTTDGQFGLRIPATELLDITQEPTVNMITELKRLIDVTDTKTIPSQKQRLAIGFGGSANRVDELFPIPKPLLTKRSRRCGACKKYMIRTQLNPSAPFRLNNSAISYLPRIVLISLYRKQPPNINALPESLSRRFCDLRSGQISFLDLEIENTFDGVAADLKFCFSPFEPTDTVEITTPDFETEIAGYDEFSDEDDSAAKPKPPKQEEENQLLPSVVLDRRQHKLRLRFNVQVKSGVAPHSVAMCSFKLLFNPRSSSHGEMQLVPVFVLGRTQ